VGVEPTIAAERRRSTVLKTAMVTGPPALPCCDSNGSDGMVVVVARRIPASAASKNIRVRKIPGRRPATCEKAARSGAPSSTFTFKNYKFRF